VTVARKEKLEMKDLMEGIKIFDCYEGENCTFRVEPDNSDYYQIRN